MQIFALMQTLANQSVNSSPPRAAYMRQWIGSAYGLSPIQRQAICWTNAHLLSIKPLGTNFSEILI